MFKTLKADIDAVMERDPAARSRAEVFFLYSGFKAVRSHRKANWCLRHNLKFLARWISQRSRHKTGIEIHPGATIGKGLFIDHGMGVVIGETTIIGDNCTIYQNVTLGGTGKETGKRHPTLGNNVLVGSGAKVLGPFKVGDNARIAAGAVVLSEVPPNATAVGVPARVVKVNGVRSETLDQIHVSDPVALALCNLEHKIFELQKQLYELKKENPSYDILPAGVLRRDANDDFYSFTLDKGSTDNVEKNDPVITENGLIGWVSDVELTTCRVRTILSPDTKTSAIDKKTSDNGIISGNAEYCDDNLTCLTKIAENNKIKVGDIVVTSGTGGVYPKNLIIGKVKELKFNSYDTTRYAVVEPYEDIRTVTSAAIITDFDGKGEVKK